MKTIYWNENFDHFHFSIKCTSYRVNKGIFSLDVLVDVDSQKLRLTEGSGRSISFGIINEDLLDPFHHDNSRD
jgi:hypothetical protein